MIVRLEITSILSGLRRRFIFWKPGQGRLGSLLSLHHYELSPVDKIDKITHESNFKKYLYKEER